MNHFLVDGRYKDIIEYHGIDVSCVLRKAKLPGDILNHKTITMKEDQYYRFLDAIEAAANVPAMAIKLSTSESIERFSPPIFAAFCSKNARMCIERLARYKKLIGPMQFHVTTEENTLTVAFLPGDPELSLSRFVVESEIAFLLNIIRRATKENIIPLAVCTAMELKDDSLSAYVGIPVQRGAVNQIVFRSSDMEIPFISFDDHMWNYFEPELNRRLADLEVDDSFSARVRAALTELLPAGICGIEDVAGELGLSKRTLQRKLSEENTTFQKQLNSTREVLALHYIKNTDMTTNDIAFLLGYAELNSFLRAFSIWTGKSISEYKEAEC